MTTTTEKYINKAVKAAAKELSGQSFDSCHFEMNILADGATQILAEALKAQAEANEANSEAMLTLANSLKPKDACLIKISEGSTKLGDCSSEAS